MTEALIPSTASDERADDRLLLEARFRFLDAHVRLLCNSLSLLQHWNSVYSAFRTDLPLTDVTVRVRAGLGDELEAWFEVSGLQRTWDGRETILPPVGLPPLNRYLWLQATAVTRSGHSLLLVGGPKTGKTALAIACLASGARLLSDGFTPLDPADLLVLPFPKALRLPRGVLRLLDIDPTHPALTPFQTRTGEIEWRAPATGLPGHQASNVAADVAAIIVLESAVVVDTPRLVPLTPADAFASLVRHLQQRPYSAVRATDALVRLSRRAPAYTLELGEPRRTADVLRHLLD